VVNFAFFRHHHAHIFTISFAQNPKLLFPHHSPLTALRATGARRIMTPHPFMKHLATPKRWVDPVVK
jgi:hypothetical protein